MENKERTLKISPELARKIWKERSDDISVSVSLNCIHGLLLENFTREELEGGKEGYTWFDSFNNSGFYIKGDKVEFVEAVSNLHQNQELFRTEKQALSALSFAQLSHIVHKYNTTDRKDKFVTMTGDLFYIVVDKWTKDLIITCKKEGLYHLGFKSEEDAKQSLMFNRELWRQYWLF